MERTPKNGMNDPNAPRSLKKSLPPRQNTEQKANRLPPKNNNLPSIKKIPSLSTNNSARNLNSSDSTKKIVPFGSGISTRRNRSNSLVNSNKGQPRNYYQSVDKNRQALPPKPEPKKADPFKILPSQKLTSIKTNDVFGPSKPKKTQGHANSFRHQYDSGSIPCRINHGSVNMKIQWNSECHPDMMPFDPILTKLFEGLVETTHPYNFISKAGCIEQLQSMNARSRAYPLLATLIQNQRACFNSDNMNTYSSGQEVLEQLSFTCEDDLNKYIKMVISMLFKKYSNKNFKEKINDVLTVLEKNGGEEVTKQIKIKIPAYYSMLM